MSGVFVPEASGGRPGNESLDRDTLSAYDPEVLANYWAGEDVSTSTISLPWRVPRGPGGYGQVAYGAGGGSESPRNDVTTMRIYPRGCRKSCVRQWFDEVKQHFEEVSFLEGFVSCKRT